jgi:ribosomal protein S26
MPKKSFKMENYISLQYSRVKEGKIYKKFVITKTLKRLVISVSCCDLSRVVHNMGSLDNNLYETFSKLL